MITFTPRLHWRHCVMLLSIALGSTFLPSISLALDLQITRAQWSPTRDLLRVDGTGTNGFDVTVSNAFDPSQVLASQAITDEAFRIRLLNPPPDPVPCRVRVEQSNGMVEEGNVLTPPADCWPKGPVPVANAGPDQTLILAAGQTEIVVTLDGSASSDADNNINAYNWSGTPNPNNVPMPQVSLGVGVHTFSLIVADALGAASFSADQVTITVLAFTGDHHVQLTFSNYQGSSSCKDCHAQEVEEAHGAIHYQWAGDSPHAFYRNESGQLVNLGRAGKMGAINDFCGYPDINFIGQLLTVDGTVVNGGCAQCHVGMGDKPSTDPQALLADGIRMQRDNIDCLMCHSVSYKRKVDAVQQGDGVTRFAFVPDGNLIPGGLNQPIGDIQRPATANCVACHAYAGGGCNSKRGDIQEVHNNPPTASFDVHMAAPAIGGAGLDCLDCHISQNHQVAGRGIDLRPSELLTVQVSCTNCHESRPHHESRIDNHTGRVDCRSCHIPTFAKLNGATDVFRDYSQPPELNLAKGLYEPHQTLQTDVQPVLLFDNGNSEFYRFLDGINPQSNGKTLIAGPLGTINDPGAKLIPVKHHMAVQPHDFVTGALLPLKMGILFTGRLGGVPLPEDEIVNQAILRGVAEVPELQHIRTGDDYNFVETERYMGISHEVTVANQALTCNSCHSATTTRIDFAALGYTPLPERTPGVANNCGSGCHSDKSDEWGPSELFTKLHQKHVTDKKLNCSACHSFAQSASQ